ncbi:ribonuclease H-like domain-containing protein [Tanacetum coccineum]|uniref:Ribonuclease H-like domain-containing protein n=1 Tax=Tanacetum coccineum TaxID=301880 RepID=A0ABQ5G2H3_9ASTR
MCDKKNNVLFTETECLVLSPDFKLLDESQVLLRVPRQSNMYSFDLKNVVPSGDLTCLFANATIDESKLWHRRMGHVNFKTMNKLVKGNLVRGLPSKIFDNDHTCVACQKGKQHKASCKAKLMSSISQPLQMLHMDLFGPTSVRSINHKTYCLVVTDDFSRSILCGMTSTNIPVSTSLPSRRLFKLLYKFQQMLQKGLWVWGEAIQKLRQKGSYEERIFKTMLHELGRSLISLLHTTITFMYKKDNEDPSWSTSFKTRRTQKTSSAVWKCLKDFYFVVFGTGQRETRPVWNNAQRINHQNKFVPSAVLTRSGRVPVSAAKKSSPIATVSTSPTRPVNTATPKKSVNVSNSRRNTFHTVNGVNTAGQTAVSAVEGNGVSAVKASANPLGNFDRKVDEGFLVGYSVNSKAFRVFNTETRKVKENLHVNFLENKPNVAGQGPNWIFDIDSLTNSMNYQPVTAGNQTDKNVGPQETNGDTSLKKNVDVGQSEEENVSTQQYIMFPLWSSISSSYKSSDEKDGDDTTDDAAAKKIVQEPASKNEQALQNVLDKMIDQEKEATEQSDAVRKEFEAQCNRQLLQGKATRASSTNSFNTVSTPVNAANAFRGVNAASSSGIFSAVGPSFIPLGGSFPIDVTNLPDDPLMPDLEDTAEIQSTGIFGNAYDDDDLDTYNYPYVDQAVGAKANFNNMELSTVEPKKIAQALDDESWVEAMQEKLLQFKIQKI